MKKSYVSVILAVLVLIIAGLWFYNDIITYDLQLVVQYAVILILLGFSVFVAILRFKSQRRGEPAEDEMSKKLLLKASSVSYYISIYMWLGVCFYSDKSDLAKDTLVIAGILGMAIIFFGSWLYFKLRGIRDA
jgi:peptidoglycan/LPS O-acetylase OafA/YrhL